MAGNNTFSGPVSIDGVAALPGFNTFLSSVSFGPNSSSTLVGNNSFHGPVTYSSTTTLTFGAATINTFTHPDGWLVNAGNVIFLGSASLPSLTMNGGVVTVSRTGGVIADLAPVSLSGANAQLILNASDNMGSLDGVTGSQITLGSGQSIGTNSNTTASFHGVITGNGSVTKAGPGSWTLGGGNAFAGTFFLDGGTVTLAANGPGLLRPEILPDAAPISIASGAILNLADRIETIGSLAGSGEVQLGTSGHLLMGALGTNTTFGGSISGSGTLTKLGAGTTTFTGNNTFTGTTLVKEGSLILDHVAGDALHDAATVRLSGVGARLEIGAAGETVGRVIGTQGSSVTLNGALTTLDTGSLILGFSTTGSGSWLKLGTADVQILGRQTHSGDTVLGAGTLKIGGDPGYATTEFQNVLSDASQLRFGGTGSQSLSFISSSTALNSFERIGSLEGGAGDTSVINLVANANVATTGDAASAPPPPPMPPMMQATMQMQQPWPPPLSPLPC
jgi:autotransporter-associated beta strand protein